MIPTEHLGMALICVELFPQTLGAMNMSMKAMAVSSHYYPTGLTA
jgi:hypothetical protein